MSSCVSTISISPDGLQRLRGLVLDLHEDAEPDLVVLELLLVRRDADEQRLVLDVVGVELARALHLVLQLAEREVEALVLDLDDARLLVEVLSARGEAAADEQGGENGEGAAQSGT